MPPYRWTLVLIAVFPIVSSASDVATAQPDPLFRSSNILDVRIVAPISTLLQNRADDQELPGKMQVREKTGTILDYDIQLRARGQFRRDRANCRFPPLRLNFKKSQTRNTLFHKQDKIKLVTHCQNSSNYEQVLLREYLAYRILNIVTHISFNVRLLRVTYVNSEKDNNEDVRYAFVIEHKNRLAARLQLSTLGIEQTKAKSLQSEYGSTISMFHYLIGNTDFSSIRGQKGETCCHNHVLFGHDEEPIWSVPYDFDQAGLVNAPHAVARPAFRIRNVRQRLYRGYCIHNDQLSNTIVRYQQMKPKILSAIHDLDIAKKRSIRSMEGYVEAFYKTLDSERRVDRVLVNACI